ncbi:hypothetical protein PGIGA_G00220430 [Pangasianodon gigas]|uniref:Uncharacterized protein n=1 Tax=Pangasianodon gigas TaxID=30993 RepID=A0ACC5WIH1_PANGG|nr:hypothetical protein [Pangasianodon gigas]
MFFDFSSTFNTIRPALLRTKLLDMQVDAPLVAWIINYLTGRPQYVRLQSHVSDTIVSSTRAPQGTVLSPYLFTLYTSDFRYYSQSCHLQKFSDDSAIVDCISRGQEAEYRNVVDSFVEWCELNHLQLNITKTKELVVDFRRQRNRPNPISIRGTEVDIVEDKYLGVHIYNKMDWTKNTEALYKKGSPEDYNLGALWENKSIRHAFIRKVYLILAAQLLVTASIVAVFTFVDPVRLFVIQYPVIYWVSLGVFLVTYLVLVCCEQARRRFPQNLVLLFIFTLAMSYMAGTISSYYETTAVFLAVGITALVCVVVTVFSFQTKVDFTSCTGLFCVLGIVVFITGIITAIVLSFQYIQWLHMLYAALGAIVYTLFLAYDTQLLLGNRAYSLSPEEYVFGALSLYTDIIQIFLFLLQITGSSSD